MESIDLLYLLVGYLLGYFACRLVTIPLLKRKGLL